MSHVPVVKQRIIPALLIRLTAALLLLGLSRMAVVAFSPSVFGSLGIGDIAYYFVVGLRFDLSALLYLNLLFILLSALPFSFRYHKLYRATLTLAYLIPNSAGLLLNIIDAGYFNYSMKRTTGEVFRALNAAGDINRLVVTYLLDYWHLLFLWLAMVIMLVVINKRFNYGLSRSKSCHSRGILLGGLVFIIIGLLTLTGMRGGWQLRPISMITASSYTPSSLHTHIILNTPFCVLTTLKNTRIADPNYFDSLEEAGNYFNPVHQGHEPGGFQALNIVVIILESFSSEFSARLNPDGEPGCTGFTPFLDSLMGKGLAFNGYANGTRSMEAVTAILSGLPSLLHTDLISSQYAGNCLPSLASSLKNKGYTSAFFHGGKNGTMNFDAFAAKTGFDEYHGMNEYGNPRDFDGKWGIYDEPFFSYFCQGLSRTPEPFLGALFSLSSHHPYAIPEEYAELFEGGKHPIHRTIQYTDHALGKFFAEASQTSWYTNTLFILTADHTSPGCEGTWPDLLHRYRVPILFFHPGKELALPQGKVVQQSDIFPTILDILAYDEPYLSFGQSIYQPDRLDYAIAGQRGNYFILRADTLVYMREAGVGKAYAADKQLTYKEIHVQGTRNVDLLGQAIWQQYIYRLNHNLLCHHR